MNAAFLSPGVGRWLLCFFLALALLCACTSHLPAASPPSVLADDAVHPLLASTLSDLIGNRTRLIQASFIIVIVGIFILWKK